jgi:hypothetical protein
MKTFRLSVGRLKNGLIMTNERSRKQDIRARMALTGEPYSVAARNIEQKAWSEFLAYAVSRIKRLSIQQSSHAFLEGAGVNYFPTAPWMHQAFQKPWVSAVYALITSSDDVNDQTLALLHEVGAEYKKLIEQGNYFCYHHYIAEFIADWGTTNTVPFDKHDLAAELERLDKKFLWTVKSAAPYKEKLRTERAAPIEFVNHIREQLRKDAASAKNAQSFSLDGILLSSWMWVLSSLPEKNMFLQMLLGRLRSLPPIKEANSDDIVYSRYNTPPATPHIELQVGDKLKFKRDGQSWIVGGASEHFTVLTRTATNKRDAGQNQYTIIDWRRGMRGAHNSYGHAVTTLEDITVVLEDLESGRIELGRNQIPTKIDWYKHQD